MILSGKEIVSFFLALKKSVSFFETDFLLQTTFYHTFMRCRINNERKPI